MRGMHESLSYRQGNWLRDSFEIWRIVAEKPICVPEAVNML